MGYLTKLQVIERKNNTKQYYMVCPAPLAQALELEKGEDIEWVVRDKQTLIIRRAAKSKGEAKSKGSR